MQTKKEEVKGTDWMFPLVPTTTKKVVLSFTALLIQAVNLEPIFPMQWQGLEAFFVSFVVVLRSVSHRARWQSLGEVLGQESEEMQ